MSDTYDYEATPVSTTKPGSPLDALREALKVKAENEPVRLRVINRPAITIVFDTNIDSERLKAWDKAAVRKTGKGKGDKDIIIWSSMILANQMSGLLYEGEEVLDPETEQPLTIRSNIFRDLLGLPDTADRELVLKTLYGSDGHLIQAAGRVMQEAGYGDDTEEMDEDENPS